jgi:hypothetical protein
LYLKYFAPLRSLDSLAFLLLFQQVTRSIGRPCHCGGSLQQVNGKCPAPFHPAGRVRPRIGAAETVSRADSGKPVRYHARTGRRNLFLTVFPNRCAECQDTYPALVYLTDKVRVIECRDRLQWIVQCRRSVCPKSWRGVSFFRTRESLLRCAGRADPAAMARLRALPERFPEAPQTLRAFSVPSIF